MRIASLDDLQGPDAGVGDHLRHLCTLIASVGKDALDERKGSSYCAQQVTCAMAILNVGGWMARLNSRPSVSRRMCRLRPVMFLPASNPCGSSAEPLFEPPCRSGC